MHCLHMLYLLSWPVLCFSIFCCLLQILHLSESIIFWTKDFRMLCIDMIHINNVERDKINENITNNIFFHFILFSLTNSWHSSKLFLTTFISMFSTVSRLSNHKHSWAFMSTHEHSWAFMSIREQSWAVWAVIIIIITSHSYDSYQIESKIL